MQAASSQGKRFADSTIAARGVDGPTGGRGAPTPCGWNLHRPSARTPAVLFNLRLSAILPGAKVDSETHWREGHG
jgi:hypothetical protein